MFIKGFTIIELQTKLRPIIYELLVIWSRIN